MKLFVVQALVIAIVVLAVAALIFRNRRAARMLTTIRDGILLYIALIFALGIFTYIRQTF